MLTDCAVFGLAENRPVLFTVFASFLIKHSVPKDNLIVRFFSGASERYSVPSKVFQGSIESSVVASGS